MTELHSLEQIQGAYIAWRKLKPSERRVVLEHLESENNPATHEISIESVMHEDDLGSVHIPVRRLLEFSFENGQFSRITLETNLRRAVAKDKSVSVLEAEHHGHD